MRLFRFSGQCGSAPVARERLQVLLAHAAADAGQSDLVAKLREEILAVIAKHLGPQRHRVLVTMDHGETVTKLEVNLQIPTTIDARVASASMPLAQAAA